MLHPRPDLRRALSLALGTCAIGQVAALACVLPRDGAAGVELRWRLPEGNRADAELPATAPRLRTCAGARVTDIEAELIDTADGARRQTFAYPCGAGDASPSERVTEPAEIFIDLRPGSYQLQLRAIDDPAERGGSGPARELGRVEQLVHVARDSVVPLDLELAAPLLPWTLELRGTAACTALTLEIFYADPDTDLHEPPPAAEARYRTGLVSEQGLRLAAPQACAGLVDGPQLFRDLDRGAYLLRLDVDGRACERSFVVDEPAAPLAVDLAKPGCAG